MSHKSASLTKYTANYRTVDDINNLKIRLRWRFSDGETDPRWQSLQLSWQQKVFSKQEREFYQIEANCVTDLEKKYHDDVSKVPETETDIYTLVNDDSVARLQDVRGCNHDDADCDVMCVMADLGEERDKLWICNEKLLVSVHYEKSSRLLTIYPDFTSDIPYKINLVGGSTARTFLYTIEHVSHVISDEIKLKEAELLKKIAKHKAALKSKGEIFRMPPKNNLEITVNMEIMYARHFEFNGICVKYVIDLPDGNWSTHAGDLEGMTRTCYQGRLEDGSAHFGYGAEIQFIYNLGSFPLEGGFPKSPCVYFEAVSMDTFDRYRCEGLTYLYLPIAKPGIYRYELECFRLVPNDLCGKLRRFFIGDASNYQDITWIGVPKTHESNVLNKFGVETVGTGILGVRLNVMHHSRAFQESLEENCDESREIFDRINSSSLVKSVEEVLKAFRRARKHMHDVKKNL